MDPSILNIAKIAYNLGIVLDNRGDRESAKRHLKQALRIDDKEFGPDQTDASAWYRKGVSLDILGRHDEAIKAYEKAIEINSQFAVAHSNFGDLLFRLSNFQEASQEADTALSLQPDPLSALLLKGRIEN